MPRFNVEADGEWACFSGIVDFFVTPFMAKEEYEKWREEEYGASNIPLERANRKTLREALFAMSLNHKDADIIANLRESGLMCSKDELV